MGVIDRLVKGPSSHPHPPKLKEIPKVLPCFTNVSVHLPSFQLSHGPTGLYNDRKGSEGDGPHKGSQASPIPGRLAHQGPVSERSTSNNFRLARDALVLAPSAALNRDPTPVTSGNNSSHTVQQLCVSQQSSISQLPSLLCGSGRENCCPSKVINKGHLQVKVGSF